MKSVVRFLAVGITVFSLPFASYGGNYESCKAYYEVKIDFVDGNSSVISENIGDFISRTMCGRIRFSNECRRKARDIAHRCMKAHWSNADSNKTPDECKPHSGVFDYNIKNLRKTVEATACSLVKSSGGNKHKVAYSLFRVTSGYSGYGPNIEKSQKELITTGSCECSRK